MLVDNKIRNGTRWALAPVARRDKHKGKAEKRKATRIKIERGRKGRDVANVFIVILGAGVRNDAMTCITSSRVGLLTKGF